MVAYSRGLRRSWEVECVNVYDASLLLVPGNFKDRIFVLDP